MTRAEVRAQLDVGLRYRVRSVCIRPADLPLAVAATRGTDTAPASVVGFPFGYHCPETKASEAAHLIKLGAHELDMVANYGLIRSGEWALVEADIAAVSAVCRPAGVLLKVIFETCELQPAEITRATEVAIAARADFVKTSTGFAAAGATPEAVKLMVAAARGRIQVKAAGGIRTRAAAEEFIRLGCARLGSGYASTPVICGDAVTG